MSNVIAAGTADGKFEISQKDVKQFVFNLFSGSGTDIDRLISVFDNSSVNRRHFSMPIEWFENQHLFSERNELFIENGIKLSIEAIEECIKQIDLKPSEIDKIIFVTSTGLSTPSIDAILLNRLNFNRHIKRSPIWGLGCAGGAVGLSRAMEYTRAYPREIVLVIALELCSLTFQKDDLSKSNIVATSLFSDGAAAAVVAGNESKYPFKKGVELIDSLSTTYNNSLDVMGWEIVDSGFKVIFSRDIPSIVTELVKPNIDELLSANGLLIEDLKYFVTHPGGLKVINAYEKSIGLNNGSLKYSRKVLSEHGNMSSPSVIYVLKEFLNDNNYVKDKFGLISSLGPGFSSELLLFRTK